MSVNHRDKISLFHSPRNNVARIKRKILEEKANFVKKEVEYIQEMSLKYQNGLSYNLQVRAQSSQEHIRTHIKCIASILTPNTDLLSADALYEQNRAELNATSQQISTLLSQLRKAQAPSFLSRHSVHFEIKGFIVFGGVAAAILTVALMLLTIPSFGFAMMIAIAVPCALTATLLLTEHLHQACRGNGLIFKEDSSSKYDFKVQSSDWHLAKEDETALMNLVGHETLTQYETFKQQLGDDNTRSNQSNRM
ncbi:MAG: hypothetical protein Q8R24_08120 [Legionellaceae bacterium]|nr:hypothetical protein [Legionellaceae bacterium]